MPLGAEKRLERRAAILATTRQLLARHGYEGVTMRALARESGVTVPTLYNSFANKDAVLSEAIEELVRLHMSVPGRDSGVRGLERIFALLEMPLGIMQAMPEYSLAVQRYFEHKRPESRMRLVEGTGKTLRLGIEELRADGQVGGHVPTEALVSTLHCILEGAVREWELGWISVPQCRRIMQLGFSLALLAISVGELHEELVRRVEALLAEPDGWQVARGSSAAK